jgi:2-amino-4-hydroxy-6-hydroxymethyldihydropteridine diphosphokinase
MSDLHPACLSLGSNIQPEENLRQAIELLKQHGRISGLSSVWQSHAVGVAGPDFLNMCVLLETRVDLPNVKAQIVQPIESALGRTRTEDKNAPRTIDIDLVMYAGTPLRLEYWEQAFMIVPLADLLPGFEHPRLKQKLAHVAEHMRRQVWIQSRMGILSGL